jgi:arylsulfatase A-like enzyme
MMKIQLRRRILECDGHFIGLSLFVLLISFAFTACSDSPAGNDESGNGGSEVSYNAVLVVIDGARYSETFGDTTHTNIPYMGDLLKPVGAVFDSFWNNGETKTNPGMTSLATGTWQHVANDGSERPTMPTFFEYFREALAAPESLALVVAGKSKLDICSYSGHPEYGSQFGANVHVGFNSDLETYQALVSYLQAEHPRLVLVNLSEVDWDGHSGIWRYYIDAIQTADSLVWELWQFLQSDSFYKGKTYLFVTNDHGRHDNAHGGFKNHGDDCEGCRHIMLLALGPKIRPNLTVLGAHSQIDVCPTIGSLIGFDTPFADGKIISGLLIADKNSRKMEIK